FSEALLQTGLASPDGVGRMLATRYRLPFVELAAESVAAEAFGEIPLHVLQRTAAVPYKVEGERLYVALADPANVSAIDELRLATRYHLELGVAARDEIVEELQRLSHTSGTSDTFEADVDENVDMVELEADDNVTDVPIVRLVNSIIL